MPLEDLIFVGFTSHVVALNRHDGEIVWKWQTSKPAWGSYISLLLDGDRLIVSVDGYMSCLDPFTGEQLWFNELKGLGTGVASLASLRGTSVNANLLLAAAAQAAAARSSTAAGA